MPWFECSLKDHPPAKIEAKAADEAKDAYLLSRNVIRSDYPVVIADSVAPEPAQADPVNPVVDPPPASPPVKAVKRANNG